jgi:hypothetical protein
MKNIFLKMKDVKGSALLITVFLLTGVFLVALGVGYMAFFAIKTGDSQSRSFKAYYAFEAAREHMAYELRMGNLGSCSTASFVNTTYTLQNQSSYSVNCTSTVETDFTVLAEYKGIKKQWPFVNCSFSGNDCLIARDEKRISDVSNLGTGIEAFFGNAQIYPTINELVDLSGNIEIAVAPPAAGICDVQADYYVYAVNPDLQSYNISFCLSSGFKCLLPATLEIQDGACPIEGGTMVLHAPVEIITPDDQRIGDIRTIAGAYVDPFYGDTQAYPTVEQYNQFAPPVPVAPTPPGGTCSLEENTYTYAVSSDYQSYSLSFCLTDGLKCYFQGAVQAGACPPLN